MSINDELMRDADENNVANNIRALIEQQNQLAPIVATSFDADDLPQEFISPSVPGGSELPTDPSFTGSFVSGPGYEFTVNGVPRVFNVAGVNGGTLQAGFAQDDGTIVGGGGAVVMDSTGYSANIPNGFDTISAYKFVRFSTGDVYSQLQAQRTVSANYIQLTTNEITGSDSYVNVISNAPTGKDSRIDISADVASAATRTRILIENFEATGKISINYGSHNADTAILGVADATLVYADASTDRVGIGTATPATKLDVVGTITSDGADLDGSVVINEAGAATGDLRAEGDTATNLLVVDASADSVEIGTTVQGAIAKFAPTEVTFNEAGSATVDLRAESDTEASMIFLDSSADKLYLGGTTNGIEISKGGDIVLLGTAKQERHVQIPIVLTGNSANYPTSVEFFTVGGFQFPTTGTKYIFAQFEVPDDWDGTDMYFEVNWFADSGAMAGTDTVRWTDEYRSIDLPNGQLINNGTAVSQAIDNTDDNAQYKPIITRFTLAYNSANQPLAARDHVFIKVWRNTAVANDFGGSITATSFELVYMSKGIPHSN